MDGKDSSESSIHDMHLHHSLAFATQDSPPPTTRNRDKHRNMPSQRNLWLRAGLWLICMTCTCWEVGCM